MAIQVRRECRGLRSWSDDDAIEHGQPAFESKGSLDAKLCGGTTSGVTRDTRSDAMTR